MAKLKTLKDLGYFTDAGEFPSFKKAREEAVFKDELKAEAIKWVRKNMEYGMTYKDFMEFFNITEEELE